MNTIDATPKFHFGVRGTLVPQRYPFVNVPLRTNTRAGKCDLAMSFVMNKVLPKSTALIAIFHRTCDAHRGT
jgi:hypothetical protein